LLEQRRIRASNVDYLQPASRSGHQRHVMAADTERGCQRRECGRSSFAIYGPLGYPDDQSPIVLTAHARTGRARVDPDGNAHRPSVRHRRP
jgi:hypothetical protein